MAIIISILYILVALIVATSVAGVIYGVGALIRKNKEATIGNIKWIACCALVVAITLGMIYFSIPAHAEELPDSFYYKVVFIDEVEEVELDQFDIEDGAVAKFLLHTDDLNHLWDYWDVIEENEGEFIDYVFDKDLSNLALYWARENDIEIKINKEERITRGRIVVLTMWECDEENLFDDEVVDVYYSEFITW